MTYYEINESVSEPREVFATDLTRVQALVPKNAAPVLARDAGTTTTRNLYATASGGTPLSQPILTVNGRIEAYVQGETPVDLLINYGLSNQYTQRWTPPQVGTAGPPGGAGIALNMDDFPVIAPEVDNTGQFQRALDAAATAGRALFFLGTKTIQSVTIPSKTTLYGAGPWSVVKVSGTAPGFYPMQIQAGVTDVTLRDFSFDGNKANVTGDPDVLAAPAAAIVATGTTGSPCRRIYVEDVYQHDSKRLGIIFQNVQKGRIKAVVENNDRDGVTLYFDTKDIDIDLIVSGCGDDHLGINSGEGSTLGLCERITGRALISGPSARQKGRGVTIRGGNDIRLDLQATDVSQSAVVLNNFSSVPLTNVVLNAPQINNPGLNGLFDKNGIRVEVFDGGGYIRGVEINGGWVRGALEQGVLLKNSKTTKADDDIRDIFVDGMPVEGSTLDGINIGDPGINDVWFTRCPVRGSGGWGFSNTGGAKRVFAEKCAFYGGVNGARHRSAAGGSLKECKVYSNSGTGVNLFALSGNFDLTGNDIYSNGTDFQNDGSHSASLNGPYKVLSLSSTWDPPSTATGAAASTTKTVTGAVAGDVALASLNNASIAGLVLTATVTSANTVTVTLANLSGSTVDLANSGLRIEVRQYL